MVSAISLGSAARPSGIVETMDANPSPTATMASLQGGLLLTQVRRDPNRLRIALDAARNNLRIAAG